MRVFILGRTEVLFNAARLLSERHEVCGILTAPASPEYARNADDFLTLARELDAPALVSNRLGSDERGFIASSDPEICVSMNWVSILGTKATALFPRGILNAHFGDLPRYRGNAVTNWAILRREPEIVFTIHEMEPDGLDSGPIHLQRRMALREDSTIADVVQFAERNVPEMFVEAVDAIADGTARPHRQDEEGMQAFRCYPRLPSHSRIDWRDTAVDIDALVRASTQPYSGAYSYLRIEGAIRKVLVWSSRVVADAVADVGFPGHIIRNDRETGESWVYTGRGVIALRSVQYADEPKAFRPADRWRSIRMGFGIDVEEELIALTRRLEGNR